MSVKRWSTYSVSSSECKELLNREALLLESLLELISREILCWKPACCIRPLCVYPTCSSEAANDGREWL